MIEALKKSWRIFRQGTPGRRFQELHERRNPSGAKRAGYVATGVLLIVGGLATEMIPGPPSNTMILVGLIVLAHTTERGARMLDRVECRLDPLISRALGTWRKLSRPAKWIVSVVWGLLMTAAGIGLWRWMR